MKEPEVRVKDLQCLIVERSLVRDRGHYHTQIAALASLLPDHQLSLLAGPDYDFFMPYPARTMASDVARLEYLTRRAAHGSLRQKIAARADLLLSGRIWPTPRSGYGPDLVTAIRDFDLGPLDLIAIPSAALDDLAAVVEAARRLGQDRMPQTQMRFLEPSLGEPRGKLRETRMAGLLRALPPRTELGCETEELARWLSERFGHPFKGGVYLPCTIDPRFDEVTAPRQEGTSYRVGVFGAPKTRKGSARIAPIVAALRKRDTDVEIILQGEARDFEPGGVYASAVECSGDRVRIVSMVGGMPPDAFRTALLSVNAILLPYDVAAYCLQGSGLVQDAVAAMRPIVHTRGFSMRYLLQHGNAIDAVTDDDFADAIVELAQSGETFSEGCRKARDAFRSRLDHPVLFHEADR
jgi:glycosyltransferase involved in cell wall biosynthesis